MTELDKFKRSECKCDFCVSTHKLVEEWDKLVPTTLLQKNMKLAIAKLEYKIKNPDDIKYNNVRTRRYTN